MGTEAGQFCLQFDRPRGRCEMMVVDGAAIDCLELTQQDVEVSAVRLRHLPLKLRDPGDDAWMPKQPIPGVAGGGGRVTGCPCSEGRVRTFDETLTEPLVPRLQAPHLDSCHCLVLG
jgi:hypothetical protein